MTQYKKDDIRQKINEAALWVFSKKGYLNTKILDIAGDAGVSVGNIYRYYKNKDEIFYSVMPESFPGQLLEAVRAKISAAQGGLKAGSDAFESFIDFMMQHRQRIVIIFAGSRGTKYERLKASFAGELLSAVKTFYSGKYMEYIDRYGDDTVIRLIFESLIYSYGHILRQDVKQEKMAEMLAQLNLYHFSGITRLLGL